MRLNVCETEYGGGCGHYIPSHGENGCQVMIGPNQKCPCKATNLALKLNFDQIQEHRDKASVTKRRSNEQRRKNKIR